MDSLELLHDAYQRLEKEIDLLQGEIAALRTVFGETPMTQRLYMIFLVLREIPPDLNKVSSEIVKDSFQQSNESSDNMLRACLAGVAIADPKSAPALKPLMDIVCPKESGE